MRLVGLVVEDDELVRQEVITLLIDAASNRGDWLELHEAKTALKASRLFKDCPPDFAIIDYDLPNGVNGVYLACSLLKQQDDLLICMFSAMDESTVEMALEEAFGKSTISVQYKAKPVTPVEWRNFYEFARKAKLRAKNEFLFDGLVESYQKAYSEHERLRLLNLLGERAVRTSAVIFGSFFPQEIETFVDKWEGRPFITANAFILLAQDLAAMILSESPAEAIDLQVKYLARGVRDELVSAFRFVLQSENSNKHQSHKDEFELRELLAREHVKIGALHEFIADLRDIRFFAKEEESKFCDQLIWFGRSAAKRETFDLLVSPSMPQCGLRVGERHLDIRPLMMMERCDLCKCVHPFHLHRVSKRELFYQWSCGSERSVLHR